MTAVATPVAEEQRILLEGISWETYEALLDQFANPTGAVRLAYDEGSLEIMSVSFGHENFGELFGRFIETLTLELDIPIRSGGSTTLRRKLKLKGLEPDKCYWLRNEAAMRGKRDFDIKTDPPPDLAVEIEISRSMLDRLPIYAALRVPEIWRFDGEEVHVHVFHKGKYVARKSSPTFPFLLLEKLVEFVHLSEHEEETSLMRSFIRWVRSDILPRYEAGKRNGSGRGNGKK